MASSASSPERATHRTVILLHQSDKAKLERLASKEKISSAEVIRRFIRHGEALFRNKQEEQVIEAALKMISTAVSDTNASLSRTMDKLDQLHAELAKRDIR
jgi:ABC-type transporter Mla subunit MlaD